mgnify:CR=1 FL=1
MLVVVVVVWWWWLLLLVQTSVEHGTLSNRISSLAFFGVCCCFNAFNEGGAHPLSCH